MSTTRIEITAGAERAGVMLGGGLVVPRLVDRGAASARIALVAGGALLLGGDSVRIEVSVGSGCSLELEEIGGTVVYRADGPPSAWTVDVRVQAGGSLSWSGLPFVVSDGAAVVRKTTVRLGAGAAACIRETLVLGRSGERGGWIDSTTSVRDDGGPILEERLVVDGRDPVVGVLGTNRVLDAVLAVGYRPRDPAAGATGPFAAGFAGCTVPAVPTVPACTVLDLEQPGAVARYLGDATHTSPLDDIWSSWRESLEASSTLSTAPETDASGPDASGPDASGPDASGLAATEPSGAEAAVRRTSAPIAISSRPRSPSPV